MWSSDSGAESVFIQLWKKPPDSLVIYLQLCGAMILDVSLWLNSFAEILLTSCCMFVALCRKPPDSLVVCLQLCGAVIQGISPCLNSCAESFLTLLLYVCSYVEQWFWGWVCFYTAVKKPPGSLVIYLQLCGAVILDVRLWLNSFAESLLTLLFYVCSSVEQWFLALVCG